MAISDDYISDAWVQLLTSETSKLRLSNLLTLFDVLENILHKQIITNEYRNFLVEFILECPSVEIDQAQFKSLVERLFECSIDDVLHGKLMKGNEIYLGETGDNFRNPDEFTQTMDIESTKFNKFMNYGTSEEKEKILRGRIRELESMLSRSQIGGYRNDRTMNKMKDLLIGYYQNLDTINISKINKSGKSINTTDRIIHRLKTNIDRQDVLVKELKRKIGDDKIDGLIGRIKSWLSRLYLLIWNFVRYPVYILLFLLVSIFILYLFFDDGYTENYEMAHDIYWDTSY